MSEGNFGVRTADSRSHRASAPVPQLGPVLISRTGGPARKPGLRLAPSGRRATRFLCRFVSCPFGV